MQVQERHSSITTLDPYRVPWFADCAPSLLTNRTIRRYLNAYSQHLWPEVIKLTLIYGVLGLEQQFPGGTLSIPQLRKLVARGGAQLVVERNLPGLQREILNLQTNLDAVFDRLAVEAPPAQASVQPGQLPDAQQRAAARPVAQQQQHVLEMAPRSKASGSRPSSALNPGPVAPKPSDEWRQGEPTGFPSPPRNRTQPLSRSTDNQGATNPIYPDWWLEAGPPPPAAPKQVPRKEPRKQPRLAYSVQQQPKEPSAAVDDLVTAEYLMMPGSGYGQGLPQPVVAGTAPPTTLTSVTADSIHTNPLFEAQQQQQAVAAPAAAAAATAVREGKASKGSRRDLHVQSKIREAVAASRHKAAAQQRRRQQLLASAVAAGSSLFGNTGAATQAVQQGGSGSSAAAEAVATCASAAAAEQFLSNPWTSCFLQPSALQADVLTAAAGLRGVAAADEGLMLAADAAAATEDFQQQQLRAPAAYAALRSVMAVSQAAGTAEGLPASTASESFSTLQRRQQQQQQEDVPPVADAAGRVHSKGLPPNTAAAGAESSSSRGVFADITVGLNSQPAAGSAGGRQQSFSSAAAEDWHDLPVVDEQGQPEQQPQPQQHHRQAWACDYGHLEGVQPPPKPAARERRAAGKAHKRWSETWVGDFGHLEGFSRFSRDTAFKHEQQQGSGQGGGEGAVEAPSKLFMSPADLEALVAASDQLGDQHAEAGGARAPAVLMTQGEAAQPAAAVGIDAAVAAGASSAQGLAARLGALLSRWDAQTAESAGKLPGGVASLAEVSRTVAAAGFDGLGAEALAAAAPGSSGSALAAAAKTAQLPVIQEQEQEGPADVGLSAAAADAAELLRELQEAVQEMKHSTSFSTASEGVETGTSDQDNGREAAEVPVVGEEATGAASAASEAGGPAESHLEGMQETSQMLQQALSRHDALMQLIASLGAAAPSSDALLSTAASSDDTTG